MIVHRRAGRLDHEDVLAAHVLVDLHVYLAVGERRDVRVTQRKLERLGDLLRQRSIRVAREELQLVGHVVSRDGISSFVLRRPACSSAYHPCAFMYPLGSPSAAPRQASTYPLGSPSAAPRQASTYPLGSPSAAPRQASTYPLGSPSAAPRQASTYPLGSPSAAPRQTTAGSRRSDPPDGWGGRNRTSIAGSKAPSPTTERRPSGI